VLIAARAVQGVGAAVLAPSTLALLTAAFPEGPERSRAIAAYGSVAGIGTAFGLVLGRGIAPTVALGAVFLMGLVFTAISVTGVRSWILRNLPAGVAHGTGIGIGLFLLLIASNDVGLVIKNPGGGLPLALGHVTAFPVVMSVIGLAAIFGLERRRVPGGILLVVVAVSAIGLAFDPSVKFHGVFALPSLSAPGHASLIGAMDLEGALSVAVLPSVFALVMTAVFDATGTIRAVAGQSGQLDENGRGGRPAVFRRDVLLAPCGVGAVVCDRTRVDVRRPLDALEREQTAHGR